MFWNVTCVFKKFQFRTSTLWKFKTISFYLGRIWNNCNEKFLLKVSSFSNPSKMPFLILYTFLVKLLQQIFKLSFVVILRGHQTLKYCSNSSDAETVMKCKWKTSKFFLIRNGSYYCFFLLFSAHCSWIITSFESSVVSCYYQNINLSVSIFCPH